MLEYAQIHLIEQTSGSNKRPDKWGSGQPLEDIRAGRQPCMHNLPTYLSKIFISQFVSKLFWKRSGGCLQIRVGNKVPWQLQAAPSQLNWMIELDADCSMRCSDRQHADVEQGVTEKVFGIHALGDEEPVPVKADHRPGTLHDGTHFVRSNWNGMCPVVTLSLELQQRQVDALRIWNPLLENREEFSGEEECVFQGQASALAHVGSGGVGSVASEGHATDHLGRGVHGVDSVADGVFDDMLQRCVGDAEL